MRILGIETSCDETAAAVVDDDRRILSSVVLSQIAEHRDFGGVVPEIAARAHLDRIDEVVDGALRQASLTLPELDAVAATVGPGLIGGVIVGATFAKSLALAHKLPFVAVNHLEGHALTARLTDDVAFPYLLLLVSGGHSQLLEVEGVGRYRRLGTTIDDAVGEAFDKTAKLLGLGFPGGPAVEAAAKAGDPHRFALPRPMRGRPVPDFSFSGLKTAVRLEADRLAAGNSTTLEQDRADLAASFQEAVAEVLAERVGVALLDYATRHPEGRTLVVAGGVAANATLRARLTRTAEEHGFTLVAPPPRLCTDNGAMIAWAGLERLRRHGPDPLDFPVRPRWPLDPDAEAA